MGKKRKSRPRWDSRKRQLWLGTVLIKQFVHPSPIMDLILTSFEEQGWPERIDDPLHQVAGRRSTTRLRNAIHSLNRRLPNHLIRFNTVGRGKGVSWHLEQ